MTTPTTTILPVVGLYGHWRRLPKCLIFLPEIEKHPMMVALAVAAFEAIPIDGGPTNP